MEILATLPNGLPDRVCGQGFPARTDYSKYPLAQRKQLLRQLLRRACKTLWPENQVVRFQAGVALTG